MITETESRELQREGLHFLHQGLLRALEGGCHPHSSDVWQSASHFLDQAYLCFTRAAAPGIKGCYTSNLRFAALALLESASLEVDAGMPNAIESVMTKSALSQRLFAATGESLGVMAAQVPAAINNRRAGSFGLPFDLSDILLDVSTLLDIPKVRDLLQARARDLRRYPIDSRINSHVFPERDPIAVAIYHQAISFEVWRDIYEHYQSATLPHFEIEIAAIIIGFIVGVATTVTGNILTSVAEDRFKRRRKVERTAKEGASEMDLEEKLTYLILGYRLRDVHLNHPESFTLEEFYSHWERLRLPQDRPEGEHVPGVPEDLSAASKAEVRQIVAKLTERLVDHLSRANEGNNT